MKKRFFLLPVLFVCLLQCADRKDFQNPMDPTSGIAGLFSSAFIADASWRATLAATSSSIAESVYTGQLLDASGNPIANATLRVTFNGSVRADSDHLTSKALTSSTTTDSSGNFSITLRVGGASTVSATSSTGVSLGSFTLTVTSASVPAVVAVASGSLFSVTTTTGTATTGTATGTTGTAPTVSYSGSTFTYTQYSAIATLTPTLGGGSAPTGCTSSPTLPTGLSINATSCAISGTPTVIQSTTVYTITATNGFGNGSSSISIIVNSGAVVSTFAGSGTTGSTDATGISASFSLPRGIAIDSSGNIYVADLNNHKIRKITSAGVVTTLAGSGTSGSTDATGTSASFYNPTGVAVDSSGNVYVADNQNNKIRKITSAGVVTTLAGSGTQGNTDATGTSASFNGPNGVAVDSSGNVYVTDSNKIRKITSAGVVTTFAGSGISGDTDGTGTSASFSSPTGVAVDSSGNVYVADYSNRSIRKITSAGVVTTLAGSGTSGSTDGSGTSASFIGPYGVAVDSSGNVYVADQLDHKIRKISSAGVVTTLAGSGTQGSTDATGTSASFKFPNGVAVDSAGNVYVADSNNHKIRKIVP